MLYTYVNAAWQAFGWELQIKVEMINTLCQLTLATEDYLVLKK